MTYHTQPGTIPHRVVEHLKTLPRDSKMSSAELFDALGMENAGGSMNAFLSTAIAAGIIKSEPDPNDRRRSLFSLGDGVPEEPPHDFEPDEPLKRRAGKPEPKARVKPKAKVKPRADDPAVELDPKPASPIVPPLAWQAPAQDVMEVPGYERLADVLKRAYDQAAVGKGRERHASGEPFHEQVMQIGARKFGVGSLLFQAFKKSEESQRLPRDRAVAELLGAIVYLAGAVIAVEAGSDDGA